MNIEQVLDVVRRRAAVVLSCVLVTAAAALAVSEAQTKKYTATASLAFNNNQLSQQVAGLQAAGSSETQLAQENTNVKLAQLGDMAARTAETLGRRLTAEKVRRALRVEGQGESNIVNLSVTATSPKLAADIANTYSGWFVYEQQNSYRSYYGSALALVEKQLAALSPRQRSEAVGLALQARAQSLGVLAQLQAPTVRVAQAAIVPRAASSPNVSRNMVLAAVVGLLLGLTIAFLLERLGRRISEPEDLSAIYRVPLLGVVPESRALEAFLPRAAGNGAPLPPAESEAFHLIRAHLRYLNVDRELRSLLITSASPGDGKTTVALHLALAAARVGLTVLLLEADLRNPRIAKQLDIASGPGVADVLVGSVELRRAIQRFETDQPHGGEPGPVGLHVLVAGPLPPPNAAELIESAAMGALIGVAREVYDLVVIDTSPLPVVSDAFPLLRRADGVVVVGWVGRDRRAVAARLRETLADVGAPLVGVIANGFRARWPQSSYPQYRDYAGARVDSPSVSLDGGHPPSGASGSSAYVSPERASRHEPSAHVEVSSQ